MRSECNLRPRATYKEAVVSYCDALDVSLRSVATSFYDDPETDCLQRTLASEVGEIIGCLRSFDHAIETVGFDAIDGPLRWPHDKDDASPRCSNWRRITVVSS